MLSRIVRRPYLINHIFLLRFAQAPRVAGDTRSKATLDITRAASKERSTRICTRKHKRTLPSQLRLPIINAPRVAAIHRARGALLVRCPGEA